MKQYITKDSDPRSDDDLFAAHIKNRDKQAYDWLYGRNYSLGVRIVCGIILGRDPMAIAEDIVQDVWLTLYRLDTYDISRQNFRAYYRRCLYTRTMDYCKGFRNDLNPDDPAIFNHPKLVSGAQVIQARLILEEALDSLSHEDRLLLEEKINRTNLQELAETSNLSYEALRQKMSRLMRSLRKLLKDISRDLR